MEDRARSFCLTYTSKPSSTINRILADLSEECLTELRDIIAEWCLLLAYHTEASVDYRIPANYDQLYSFYQELFSDEINENVILSRVIFTLRNQNVTGVTLSNLLKSLRKCTETVEVLVYLSIITGRLGRFSSSVGYLLKAIRAGRITQFESVLRSLCLIDVEMLRFLFGSQSSGKNIPVDGVSNFAYCSEDAERSFTKETFPHVTIVDSSSVKIEMEDCDEGTTRDATSCLPNLDPDNKKDIDEVLVYIESAVSDLTDEEQNAERLATIHLRNGRVYTALGCLLQRVPKLVNANNGNIEKQAFSFDKPSQQQLYDTAIEIANRLMREDIIDENNSCHGDKYINKAVSYCFLALLLKPKDLISADLLLKALLKLDDVNKALLHCENMLKDFPDRPEFLLVKACCCVREDQYDIALVELHFALEKSPDNLKLICVCGLVHILLETTETGVDSLLKACKIDMAIAVDVSKYFRPKDLEKVKSVLSKCLQTQCGKRKKRKKAAWQKETCESNEKLEGAAVSSSGFSKFVDSEETLLFEFLIKLFPADLELHLLYVDTLVNLEQLEEAQMTLINLIKRIPEEIQPMIQLANLRMHLGAYVAAVEDFRILLRVIGTSSFAANLLALSDEDRREIARVHRQHGFRYLQKENSHADAVECFSVAIAAIGSLATGLILARGFCYVHLNEYASARNDFTSVLTFDSNNAAAFCGRSVTFAMLGLRDSCIKDIEVALRLDSEKSEQALKKLPFKCVEVFGQMLLEHASSLIRQLSETGPEKMEEILDEEDLEMLIEFLHNAFHETYHYCKLYLEFLIVSEQFEEASDKIDLMLKNNPDDPWLASLHGFILIKLSNAEESVDILNKLTESETAHLKKVLNRLSDTERKEICKISAKKAEDSSQHKNTSDAIKHYSLALLAINGKDIGLLRGRYKCFQSEGNSEKAVEDLSLIIDIKPELQDLCARAKYHDSFGREKSACEDYIRALEIDEVCTIKTLEQESLLKSTVTLFYNAANGLFVSQQHQEVLRFCEFGLKLDQNHKGLKQLRYRTKCVVNKCVIQ